MVYKLKRTILNPDFLIALAFIGLVLITAIIWCFLTPTYIPFIILFLIALIYLVYLTNRKYLSELIIDFEKERISSVSILTFIRNDYSFFDIRHVKIIESAGFINKSAGYRNQNFVLIIKNKWQPIIFEIRNEKDDTSLKEVVEKLNKTVPNEPAAEQCGRFPKAGIHQTCK